jgi:diguanylate cyclase (GGDEF)-like protein
LIFRHIHDRIDTDEGIASTCHPFLRRRFLIEQSGIARRVGLSATLMAFSVVLWLTQPFLLFHTVVESISIFLAMSLFIIGTQTYKYSRNDVLYFLSLAFFFVSLFDGMHTLAYKGMDLIPGATVNMATQLWIAGRLLQIGTLCMIPFFHRFTFKKGFQETLFIIVSGFLGTLIITGNFPICYVEGVGLTAFKKIVEYTIVAVAMIAFVVVGKLNIVQSKRVLLYVRCALVALAASELSFTVYKDVYGIMNMLGHLLKILSYLFVWIMVVEEGFAKPYDHMFKQLYDNSIRDQLTGLYNRRYYEMVLTEELKNTTRLSIVHADINGLKLINDAFGHDEGDRAIVWFASEMKGRCRPTDRIVRIGGDEFMILMPDTSLSAALAIVQGIDSGFRSRTIVGIQLSAAFGCIEKIAQGMQWDELYKRAEAQMYRQKLSNSPKVKSKIIECVMQSVFEGACAQHERGLIERGDRPEDGIHRGAGG